MEFLQEARSMGSASFRDSEVVGRRLEHSVSSPFITSHLQVHLSLPALQYQSSVLLLSLHCPLAQRLALWGRDTGQLVGLLPSVGFFQPCLAASSRWPLSVAASPALSLQKPSQQCPWRGVHWGQFLCSLLPPGEDHCPAHPVNSFPAHTAGTHSRALVGMAAPTLTAAPPTRPPSPACRVLRLNTAVGVARPRTPGWRFPANFTCPASFRVPLPQGLGLRPGEMWPSPGDLHLSARLVPLLYLLVFYWLAFSWFGWTNPSWLKSSVNCNTNFVCSTLCVFSLSCWTLTDHLAEANSSRS